MLYRVDSVIRHTGAFLRSAGWYTNVPINGVVVGIISEDNDRQILRVLWSEGYIGHTLSTNVEPCPRAARVLSFRNIGIGRK